LFGNLSACKGLVVIYDAGVHSSEEVTKLWKKYTPKVKPFLQAGIAAIETKGSQS
jgi:hypothetical protein